MTAFASSADMIARYDAAVLGDLCNDDGNRIAEPDLDGNQKMDAALAGATGQIKAACLRAERYTTAQLEALTGDSLAYLKDITCALAFWRLWKRKPYDMLHDSIRKDAEADAQELIEMLRRGDHVFDIDAHKDKGHEQIETVTNAEINSEWNLSVDQARRARFFPARRTVSNR